MTPERRISRSCEGDPCTRVARRSRLHGRWLRCHQEDRRARTNEPSTGHEGGRNPDRPGSPHDHGRRHNDYSERKDGHKDQVQGMARPRRQGPASRERGKRRWRNSLAERGPADNAPDAVEPLGERIADGCLHVLRVAKRSPGPVSSRLSPSTRRPTNPTGAPEKPGRCPLPAGPAAGYVRVWSTAIAPTRGRSGLRRGVRRNAANGDT
jgi:hypothetical protein